MGCGLKLGVERLMMVVYLVKIDLDEIWDVMVWEGVKRKGVLNKVFEWFFGKGKKWGCWGLEGDDYLIVWIRFWLGIKIVYYDFKCKLGGLCCDIYG